MELILYSTFFNTFWTSSLFCFCIDFFMPQYRVNKVTTELLLNDYYNMFPIVILNIAAAYPYFYAVENYLMDYEPNQQYFILNLVAWLFTTDVLFYSIHRTFHNKYLYPYHAIHHRYKYTYGMGSVYAHTLEFYLANLFPINAPMVLYSIPLEMCNAIVFFATFYTIVISHGGFKTELGSSHLYHHLKYKYNFGLLKMDKFMGTKYLANN